jgi:hypothetical protein
MRNLLLLFVTVLTLSLNSCSKDNDNESNNNQTALNTISFKVNGIQKIFNAATFEVNDNWVYISGSIGDNESATETVFFYISPYETSNSDIQSFRYRTPEGEYNTINTSFDNYRVISNPNNKTSSGTFSGSVTLIGGHGESLNITDGAFSVKY